MIRSNARRSEGNFISPRADKFEIARLLMRFLVKGCVQVLHSSLETEKAVQRVIPMRVPSTDVTILSLWSQYLVAILTYSKLLYVLLIRMSSVRTAPLRNSG